LRWSVRKAVLSFKKWGKEETPRRKKYWSKMDTNQIRTNTDSEWEKNISKSIVANQKCLQSSKSISERIIACNC